MNELNKEESIVLLRKRVYAAMAIMMLVGTMIVLGQSANEGEFLGSLVSSVVLTGVNLAFVVMAMEYFVFYRVSRLNEDVLSIQDENTDIRKIQGYIGDDELGTVSCFINQLLEDNKNEKKKSKKSDELYLSIVDEIPFLVHRFKPDGTITFVNKPYSGAMGKSKEDLIGKNVFEIIKDLGGEGKRLMRELSYLRPESPTGTSFYDSPKVKTDAEASWAVWINQAFFDEYGRVTEYQSIGIDIYQKTKDGLDSMINDFIEMIYFVNKEGKLKYVSPTSKIVLGHGFNDMVGKKFVDFVHEKDKEAVTNNIQKHFSGEGEKTVQELRIKNSQNQYAWIQTEMDSVYNEDGDISDVAINAKDITEIKQVGERFGDIYKRVWSNVTKLSSKDFIERKNPVITLVWSPEEKGMRYVSSEDVVFGYSKESFILGDIKLKDIIHQEDLHKYPHDQTVGMSQYRVVGKDDKVFNVQDRSVSMIEDGKKVLYKELRILTH